MAVFDDGAKREPSGRLILTAADRERIVAYNKRSKAVLDLFADRLPAESLESYRTLSFAGELSFMVRQLTATLSIAKIPVTAAEAETLREVTSADSAEYLAALTIVPQEPTAPNG